MTFSKYPHILFALFTSSLYGNIRSENVVCYECPGLSHPRDCTKTVDCGPNQLCFVRRYRTHDGHIYYNSGCLSRELCHDDHGILVGRQASGSHHLECSSCCTGNFCNTDLCETHPVNSTRKRCMSCESVDHLEDCQTVQGCHADEMCYTTHYLNTFGEKRFRLGCTKTNDCLDGGNSLIGEFQYCSQCCLHDHCNRELCTDPTTAPVPTTTLPTVCEDDPSRPCVSSLLHSICPDYQFRQFCKRSCGLCDPTTAHTTSSTPSPVCEDDSSRHCDPSILSVLCADSVFSQFCKKSCGLCGTTTSPGISVPTVTISAPSGCQDSGHQSCDNEILPIVCHDDVMKYHCRKSCNLCDVIAATSTATTTTASTCRDNDVRCSITSFLMLACLDPVQRNLCKKSCKMCP